MSTNGHKDSGARSQESVRVEGNPVDPARRPDPLILRIVDGSIQASSSDGTRQG